MSEEQVKPSPQVPSQVPAKTTGMPPLQELYNDAWLLLKRTFKSQLKVFGLIVLGIIAIVIVIGVLVFLGGVATGLRNQVLDVVVIIGALALIVGYAIGLIYFTSVAQIMYIKIFASETKLPIIATAKQSAPMIWGFFSTLFLSQVYILGGIFAFIVPGVIMAFLFTFVSYVFVVENLNRMPALQRSYQIVRPNIKKIFLAIILVEVGYNIVAQVLSYASEKTWWVYFISIPLAIGFSLYSQALHFTLYKRAKATITNQPLPDLKWVKVWATIGLVLIGIIFILLIFSAASQIAGSGLKLPPMK